MTLLTKVAHDAVVDSVNNYIAINGEDNADGIAVDLCFEEVMDQLSAWPQSKVEQKEIRESIKRKLGIYE